jgi:hypothetical protein
MSEKQLEMQSSVEKWRGGGYRAKVSFNGADLFCIHEDAGHALEGAELAALEHLSELKKQYSSFEGVETVRFTRTDTSGVTKDTALATEEDLNGVLRRAVRAVDFNPQVVERLERSVKLAQEFAATYDEVGNVEALMKRSKVINKLLPRKIEPEKTYHSSKKALRKVFDGLFGAGASDGLTKALKSAVGPIADDMIASGCGRSDCKHCNPTNPARSRA